MLIRRAARPDSIVARSQCSKEFCNTFPPKADMCSAPGVTLKTMPGAPIIRLNLRKKFTDRPHLQQLADLPFLVLLPIGQTAAPPTSAMNSRRLMASHLTGLRIIPCPPNRKRGQWLMSALGHERTSWDVTSLSA